MTCENAIDRTTDRTLSVPRRPSRASRVPRTIRHRLSVEWPTVSLIVFCHASWCGLVFAGTSAFGSLGTVLLLIPLLTLYASLQHEVLHGHPFGLRWLDDMLVAAPYGLVVPYGRFRSLHLAHHRDETLTDPYDDPESNFLHPADWRRLPPVLKALYRANNTLLGRVAIGPVLGTWRFWRDDRRVLASGDRTRVSECRRAWLWHGLGLLALLPVLWLPGTLSPVGYGLAVFGSLALLRIRTFLEHRAHADVAGRTVVIESRGPLAFLFLFNSLHAVHHRHPRLPWFRLHAYFRSHRARVLAGNGDYRFRSYGEVILRYWRRPKDPVPHPLHGILVDASLPARTAGCTALVVHSLQPDRFARVATESDRHDPTAAFARQPAPQTIGLEPRSIGHERRSGEDARRLGHGPG